MGTKNNPSQFDCYANAGADEPMFILLARDRHAPTLVWLWATLRELDGEKPQVVAEARDCVADMIQWAAAHNRRSCGLAQATLAGMVELIRTVNGAVKSAENAPTGLETLRRWLAATEFERTVDAGAEAPRDA